jgi:DNA-entry nuclease
MNWLKKSIAWLLLTMILLSTLCGCSMLDELTGRGNGGDLGSRPSEDEDTDLSAGGYASIEGIPDYAGDPYVELNGNVPLSTSEEITAVSFETYAELDSLGRCGLTIACIGRDLMPTKNRESISSVTPSGWKNKKYDSKLVDGGWIYNRCHLIGFQLAGENANERNLITGTRYLNIDGMLPFENMVADYVKETGNHVMYRVTPLYAGTNLLASGVRIEGYSVEDEGEGLCFHVFAYNVQPGITINYATGENCLNGEYTPPAEEDSEPLGEVTYVLNTSSKKFHLPTCAGVQDMKEENRKETDKDKETLLQDGYTACGTCKP